MRGRKPDLTVGKRIPIGNLTAVLAEHIMGWGVAPDRFLLGSRRWLPTWRFQPMDKLHHAFQLLEKAAPAEYSMGSGGSGFWVRVRIGETTGEARDRSKPRAITLALARALGLEVDQ
jgi:hypothetical protein